MRKGRSAETVREFGGYTSLHGLGRIADAKYMVQKVVWALLAMAAFGMCIFQVSRLAQQFLNFQVNTKVEQKQEKQYFPGVTFCNVNPVKFSHLINVSTLFQIVEKMSNITNVHLDQFKPFDGAAYPTYNYTEELITDADYQDPMTTAQMIFQARLAAMSLHELKAISPNLTEFVIDCKYKGRKCMSEHFTPQMSTEYGICYRFEEAEQHVETAGKARGLELILNVEQGEYVPFLTQSAGVVYEIHDVEYDADISTNGVVLPIGTEINIGIQTTKNVRLPGPTKKCDEESSYLNVLSCLQDCTRTVIARTCYCNPPKMSDADEYGDPMPPCMTLDDVICMERTSVSVKTETECPECKVPCTDTAYDQSVSMTTWPSSSYEGILEKKIAKGGHELVFKDVKNDLLLVRIYFKTLLTEVITEVEAYTDENFVSDIGGQLGLWIGMSVMSMAEVLELIVLLCIACCSKKDSKVHKVTESELEKAGMDGE